MKNKFNPFNNLSLRKRLIISAILCIFLPIIITMFFNNYFMKYNLVEKATSQSKNTLEVLDLNISNHMEQLLYLSNYIQMDNEIISILRNISDDKITEPNSYALNHLKISQRLENITNLLNPLYLTILIENSFYYTNYPFHEYDPHNLHNEDWIKNRDVLNHLSASWIGVHPNYIESLSNKKPYLISIARSVKVSETKDALILLSISENDISTFFEKYNNDDQHFMLIDYEGTILSHSDDQYIQQNLDILDQQENENNGSNIVTYDNAKYLMLTHPLSYADWQLVSMTPYNSVVGNIDIITSNSLLLQVITFIFFMIILILLVNRMTKPISHLSYVANEVESGNIQVRTGIKGDGDVAKLGHSFDNMLDEIENMIKKIKYKENSKRKAELEMLQAQINPHFLFNILNSLRLKTMMNGDQEISGLIKSLSQLLRMTINRNNEFIPLEKEFEIIEHYVKLMNFKGQLNIKIKDDLSRDTLLEEVPRFILQPLVENSIHHGYMINSGDVMIASRREKGYLVIHVIDHGRGMSQEELAQLKKSLVLITESTKKMKTKKHFTGIGVSNVYQRLLLIYGKNFRMDIKSEQPGGTKITLYIPKGEEWSE